MQIEGLELRGFWGGSMWGAVLVLRSAEVEQMGWVEDRSAEWIFMWAFGAAVRAHYIL